MSEARCLLPSGDCSQATDARGKMKGPAVEFRNMAECPHSEHILMQRYARKGFPTVDSVIATENASRKYSSVEIKTNKDDVEALPAFLIVLPGGPSCDNLVSLQYAVDHKSLLYIKMITNSWDPEDCVKVQLCDYVHHTSIGHEYKALLTFPHLEKPPLYRIVKAHGRVSVFLFKELSPDEYNTYIKNPGHLPEAHRSPEKEEDGGADDGGDAATPATGRKQIKHRTRKL